MSDQPKEHNPDGLTPEQVGAPEWRPICGYEGLYEISSTGCVRSYTSHHGRVACPKDKAAVVNVYGYRAVGLYKSAKLKSFRVARLVGAAFIPNPDAKPQVNHKNGNKLDDRVENLEWVTGSENSAHAFRIGLSPRLTGTKNHSAKLTHAKVSEIRNRLSSGESMASVAADYRVSEGAIFKIKHNQSWTN